MKRPILHPEARAEYHNAAFYYASQQPELGRRFYHEIERLIAESCQAPGTFRFIHQPARRHITREFPYGIIYVERPDDIWILAVMHLHREPGYWRHRMNKK